MDKLNLLVALSILRQRSHSGFTLIELLLATILTGIIAAGSSVGLMTILSANAEAEHDTLRRVEANRALDYIAEDIRMANAVETIPSGSTLPSGATGVMKITIPDDPDNPGNPVDVVYFVVDDSVADTDWLGDYVIYRAKDDYSGGINIANLNATGVNALVDALGDPASTPSYSDPACSNTLTGDNGFFACIDTSDNRTVEISLYSKQEDISDPLHRSATTVFARSN